MAKINKKTLSTKEVSILLNVSDQTILNWSKSWLKDAKVERGKYDITKVNNLYLKNIVEAEYAVIGDVDSISHSRKRYENARAKRWEMDVERKKSQLLPMTDARKQFLERNIALKKTLNTLSRRVAKKLGDNEAVPVLDKELSDILSAYARPILFASGAVVKSK